MRRLLSSDPVLRGLKSRVGVARSPLSSKLGGFHIQGVCGSSPLYSDGSFLQIKRNQRNATLISVQVYRAKNRNCNAPLDHSFQTQTIVRQFRIPITWRGRFRYALVRVEIGRKPSHTGCPWLLLILHVCKWVVLPISSVPTWVCCRLPGNRGWAWIAWREDDVSARRPAVCPSLRRRRLLLRLH